MREKKRKKKRFNKQKQKHRKSIELECIPHCVLCNRVRCYWKTALAVKSGTKHGASARNAACAFATNQSGIGKNWLPRKRAKKGFSDCSRLATRTSEKYFLPFYDSCLSFLFSRVSRMEVSFSFSKILASWATKRRSENVLSEEFDNKTKSRRWSETQMRKYLDALLLCEPLKREWIPQLTYHNIE